MREHPFMHMDWWQAKQARSYRLPMCVVRYNTPTPIMDTIEKTGNLLGKSGTEGTGFRNKWELGGGVRRGLLKAGKSVGKGAGRYMADQIGAP